jgi:LmbE family N-acetylglucosaminyl deacetylase
MNGTADIDELGTVLGVWAHPDDEAFLSAGLMARLTDRGARVACVTATRGERGTPDPESWPAERLGRRRAAELRASLAAVGVTQHRFLGYLDGTLPSVPLSEGAHRVSQAIDEVRPDTVVTFGPEGMTGHADHVAVSRWVASAVARSARPLRVLHATTTESFVRDWSPVNDALEVFGSGLPLATPSDELALELCLAPDELDRKLVALAAQSSQILPLIDELGEERFRAWWATEAFVAPRPASIGGRDGARPSIPVVASGRWMPSSSRSPARSVSS